MSQIGWHDARPLASSQPPSAAHSHRPRPRSAETASPPTGGEGTGRGNSSLVRPSDRRAPIESFGETAGMWWRQLLTGSLCQWGMDCQNKQHFIHYTQVDRDIMEKYLGVKQMPNCKNEFSIVKHASLYQHLYAIKVKDTAKDTVNWV